MQPELPRVWLRLSVAARGARFEIDAEGSDGRTLRVEDRANAPVLSLDNPLPIAAVLLPTGLADLTAELGAPLIGQYREGTQGPAGFPVFVRPPAGLEAMRWDTLAEPALRVATFQPGAPAAPEPIRTIVESTNALPAPGRFHLPLRLVVTGPRALDIATHLREFSSWFREPDLVQLVVATDPTDVRRSPERTDVLVTDDDSIAALAGLTATLAIVLAPSPAPGELLGARPVLPVLRARSIVAFDDDDIAAVTDLLEELTHDVPLHDAVANIPRPEAATLVSSPTAVHDLRLRDLVTQAALDVYDLETTAENRLAFDVAPAVSFDRESHGLFPLAQWRRQFVQDLAALGPQPRLRGGGPATPPRRVVDITVRRDPSIATTEDTPFVRPQLGLQASGRYHLRVRIGAPSQWSVMEGTVEPIDSLLTPNPRGHELEVVLFAGDFTIEGEAVARIFLPDGAPSEAIEFAVRAPDVLGAATCRVGVYHRRNLLQTFLFTADIVEVEQETVDGTRARQDHGTTSRWDNLDALGGRRLSVVLNDDGESHRVYVHGAGAPADWKLNASVQTDLVQPIRRALTEHVDKNTPPEDALRALAVAGEELALRLDERLGRDATAKSLFRGLAGENDQLVQVVRADVHQAIPWGLLYDWILPADTAGALICWGVDGGATCTHATGDDVICVRGFWGVRHRIEELVGSTDDPPLKIPVTGTLAVDLARGLRPNQYLDDLTTHLAGATDLHELAAADSLLDRLWADDRSPICAVIGHMNAADEIECGTSEGGITASDITRHARQQGADIDDPHPLLLLFVCDSAAVTPEQVASQALALTSAGVAGLVATESIVRSSHVREFGTALIDELVAVVGSNDTFPFATALQRARRTVLASQLVPGLSFLGFGPASLSFEVTP